MPATTQRVNNDEIISTISPEKLSKSKLNAIDHPAVERRNSGNNITITPSDANTTSHGKLVNIECSPAHTGRMFMRKKIDNSNS